MEARRKAAAIAVEAQLCFHCSAEGREMLGVRVHSSRKIIDGSVISAAAMATRFRSPPSTRPHCQNADTPSRHPIRKTLPRRRGGVSRTAVAGRLRSRAADSALAGVGARLADQRPALPGGPGRCYWKWLPHPGRGRRIFVLTELFRVNGAVRLQR